MTFTPEVLRDLGLSLSGRPAGPDCYPSSLLPLMTGVNNGSMRKLIVARALLERTFPAAPLDGLFRVQSHSIELPDQEQRAATSRVARLVIEVNSRTEEGRQALAALGIAERLARTGG